MNWLLVAHRSLCLQTRQYMVITCNMVAPLSQWLVPGVVHGFPMEE